MTDEASRSTAADRLIRLARRRCEDLGKRIGELEKARADISIAILSVDEGVAAERRAISPDDPVALGDLARYEAAAEQKRASLSASSCAIGAEIESARLALVDAFAELKKLEHVAALARQSSARRRAARDLAALDEAARNRFAARR
jgi:hypothetical protein